MVKRIVIFSFFIVIGIFSFFLIYNYGYLFEKEERGHLASMLFNLNKFEIDISEENKSNCEIFWNDIIIYKDGKFLSKNINSSRYEYGDNCFKVSMNNKSKTYYFFKPNNWEYHNFKFSVNEEISFWMDGIIQNETEEL